LSGGFVPVVLRLPVTVCGSPKGGIFTTKVDLKNLTSINHKTVFGTRDTAFWEGAVISRFSIYHPFQLIQKLTLSKSLRHFQLFLSYIARKHFCCLVG
jgi:hypothetical protein